MLLTAGIFRSTEGVHVDGAAVWAREAGNRRRVTAGASADVQALGPASRCRHLINSAGNVERVPGVESRHGGNRVLQRGSAATAEGD